MLFRSWCDVFLLKLSNFLVYNLGIFTIPDIENEPFPKSLKVNILKSIFIDLRFFDLEFMKTVINVSSPGNPTCFIIPNESLKKILMTGMLFSYFNTNDSISL